jgi:hypothetical protein
MPFNIYLKQSSKTGKFPNFFFLSSGTWLPLSLRAQTCGAAAFLFLGNALYGKHYSDNVDLIAYFVQAG